MKKLQIMGGGDIIISDEEAQKIMEVANDAKFVALSSGNFINVSSISCIVDFKGIPFLESYSNQSRVYESQNGSCYIIKDQERIPLSDDDYYGIKYFDPKVVEQNIEAVKEHRLLESAKYEKKRKEKEAEDEKIRKQKEDENRKEKERWESLSEEEKNRERIKKLNDEIERNNNLLEKRKSEFMVDWIAGKNKNLKEQIDLIEEKMCEV
jgi:hypothetical protein